MATDLDLIAEQERLLRFTAFDPDTAWQLGNLLHAALKARNAGGTAEIELAGQLLFACTTPGAKPDQANWIRRKRNTVHRFERSSYGVGRELARDSQTLESAHGLSETDHAAHGGGFPLWLSIDGAPVCAGTIIVSGLPQREDHNLVVAALAQHLGLIVPTLL